MSAMRLFFALLLILPLSAAPVFAAGNVDTPLPPAVAKALARAKIPASAVSFVVEEAGTATSPNSRGKALLRHRADVPVNPASVMKLVTTMAALETLGPNWHWKTPVYL